MAIADNSDAILREQTQRYNQNCVLINRDLEDVEQIDDIIDLFTTRKIKVLKFNHSLESSFQRYCYWEGYF